MITNKVSTMIWQNLYLDIAYEDILGSVNKRIAGLIQVVYSVEIAYKIWESPMGTEVNEIALRHALSPFLANHSYILWIQAWKVMNRTKNTGGEYFRLAKPPKF